MEAVGSPAQAMRARKALGETFYFEKAWKGGCWRSVAELVGWRVQHGEEGWRERKELAVCSGHSMSKVMDVDI